MRRSGALSLVTIWIVGIVLNPGTLGAAGRGKTPSVQGPHIEPLAPATPIQHVVVIFQENVSFDHYFGAYPTPLTPQRNLRSPLFRERRRLPGS